MRGPRGWGCDLGPWGWVLDHCAGSGFKNQSALGAHPRFAAAALWVGRRGLTLTFSTPTPHNPPPPRVASLPDLTITDSSEAMLQGRRPPFRLLAWAPGSSAGAAVAWGLGVSRVS